MHSWVKGIQVCKNERSHAFPKGEFYEKAKIHLRNLKIFGIQFHSNKGPYPFPRGDKIEIAKNTLTKFQWLQLCQNHRTISIKHSTRDRYL